MCLAPAVLISDQVDYAPGGTVLLTGTGFQPGESIVVPVLHPDSPHNTGPGHTPCKVSHLGSQILAGTSGDSTQQVLFVNDLYNTLLARVPSAGEVSGWVLQLQAGVSREQVTTGFLLSTEYLAPIVEQNYQQVLNRSADAAGLAAWVIAMQQGLSESGLMAQLQASTEYAVTHPDNALLLMGLGTDDLEWGSQ